MVDKLECRFNRFCMLSIAHVLVGEVTMHFSDCRKAVFKGRSPGIETLKVFHRLSPTQGVAGIFHQAVMTRYGVDDVVDHTPEHPVCSCVESSGQ